MNNINYLEKLLQDNIQYDVKKSISSSKLVKDELKKQYPEAILWENSNNEIRFTSKSEFERLLEFYLSRDGVNNMPNIIAKFTDPDAIREVDRIICSNLSYNDKIVGLINVINPSLRLILK